MVLIIAVGVALSLVLIILVSKLVVATSAALVCALPSIVVLWIVLAAVRAMIQAAFK